MVSFDMLRHAVRNLKNALVRLRRELELPEADVAEALDAVCAPVSLYDPVYADGGDPLTVMDQVSDEKNGDRLWLENLSLNEAMQHLSEREKKIVNLRFFEGKTQMEVAGYLGISQAQVSRLEKKILGMLKEKIS